MDFTNNATIVLYTQKQCTLHSFFFCFVHRLLTMNEQKTTKNKNHWKKHSSHFWIFEMQNDRSFFFSIICRFLLFYFFFSVFLFFRSFYFAFCIASPVRFIVRWILFGHLPRSARLLYSPNKQNSIEIHGTFIINNE